MTSEEESLPEDLRCERRRLLRSLVATYANGSVDEIAIVGNAPLPPDRRRADRIDACDLVVRMTSFVVDHGEPRYGGRADVVFVHRGTIASPDTFARHPQRLYLLVESGRRHWEPSTMPHWWPSDLGLVHWPNDLFSDPLAKELGYSPHRPEWATTGTLAAWSMHQLFPQAHLMLAGFSIMADPEQRLLDHAWGQPVTLTAEHRLHEEAALIARFRDEGTVTLLQ